MRILKITVLIGAALWLSACRQEKVVETPPPAPVYVPPPLISLELARPVLKNKRGPVGANINFINISPSTYQYLLFRTTAYDKNGKVIKPRKSRDHRAYLRVAGPIPPGTYSSGHNWENTWKGTSVQCIDIDHVEIVFADGSIEEASGDRLTKLNTESCFN